MSWTGYRVVGLVGLAVAVLLWAQRPADAITAELAKTCRDKALKAYPRLPPGTKTGNAKAQQDYYRDCLAKQGNSTDSTQR